MELSGYPVEWISITFQGIGRSMVLPLLTSRMCEADRTQLRTSQAWLPAPVTDLSPYRPVPVAVVLTLASVTRVPSGRISLVVVKPQATGPTVAVTTKDPGAPLSWNEMPVVSPLSFRFTLKKQGWYIRLCMEAEKSKTEMISGFTLKFDCW